MTLSWRKLKRYGSPGHFSNLKTVFVRVFRCVYHHIPLMSLQIFQPWGNGKVEIKRKVWRNAKQADKTAFCSYQGHACLHHTATSVVLWLGGKVKPGVVIEQARQVYHWMQLQWFTQTELNVRDTNTGPPPNSSPTHYLCRPCTLIHSLAISPCIIGWILKNFTHRCPFRNSSNVIHNCNYTARSNKMEHW